MESSSGGRRPLSMYTPLNKMESSSGGRSADSTFVGAGGLHLDVPLRVAAVPEAIPPAVGIVRFRTHLWNTPNTPVISPSATRPSFQETSLPRQNISCAYNRSKNTIRSKCHSLIDDGPPTLNQVWLTTEWPVHWPTSNQVWLTTAVLQNVGLNS